MRSLFVLVPLAVVAGHILIAQPKGPPVENEFVRVVMGNDRPATAPGPVHEHKQNRVMIYLDAGDIQIKHTDGRVENQHWKVGDIAWSPSDGMHTSQNVSASPVRIVEIELRNQPKPDAPAKKGAILDNAQTSVYRSSVAPAAGTNFLAVDEKTASVVWNKLPEGSGPFVIVEVK